VFTLLLMLMARCFDRLEAAVAWLQPVYALPASPAAARIAARGPMPRGAHVPRSVAVPKPPPGCRLWL